ncbi:hypothetical protein BCR44DRAFT_1433982 [Catenaria anguillulae PL171]|uniref:Uncharacterized protein n=1 Tax=Catenaria anguillulae PL171 TaxID=765915 RepID=A0A1Y2HRD0_9FUNG|nr:hypothetical protein BCR44DRAFT_1433982 [Catenaria anguillulae PL171]
MLAAAKIRNRMVGGRLDGRVVGNRAGRGRAQGIDVARPGGRGGGTHANKAWCRVPGFTPESECRVGRLDRSQCQCAGLGGLWRLSGGARRSPAVSHPARVHALLPAVYAVVVDCRRIALVSAAAARVGCEHDESWDCQVWWTCSSCGKGGWWGNGDRVFSVRFGNVGQG